VAGVARNLSRGVLLRPEGPKFEAEGLEREGLLREGCRLQRATPCQIRRLGSAISSSIGLRDRVPTASSSGIGYYKPAAEQNSRA